jgi:hypothetical protein
VILFGERSLRRAMSEYVEHFHAERNHQGKGLEQPLESARALAGVKRQYEDEEKQQFHVQSPTLGCLSWVLYLVPRLLSQFACPNVLI